MPTVEELDDMYPELGRREVAVLAKGENWAVVYNPSGAVAHWHKELYREEKKGGTLLGRAKRTLRRPVHLVGRLDRSVSGLSLLAFDPETAEALQSVNASKVYYALCRNSGETFLDRGRFAVTRPLLDKKPFGKKHGNIMKESYTDVEVLVGGKDPNCCLVRAEPKTGRYHQIRRHLRNITLPILGDTYCKKRTREYFESFGIQLPRRVMLHLYSIRVPATEKTPEIYVTCPLPPNFQHFIRDSFPSWASQAQELLPELFLVAPVKLPPVPPVTPKALEARNTVTPPRRGLWVRFKDWLQRRGLGRRETTSLARHW